MGTARDALIRAFCIFRARADAWTLFLRLPFCPAKGNDLGLLPYRNLPTLPCTGEREKLPNGPGCKGRLGGETLNETDAAESTEEPYMCLEECDDDAGEFLPFAEIPAPGICIIAEREPLPADAAADQG